MAQGVGTQEDERKLPASVVAVIRRMATGETTAADATAVGQVLDAAVTVTRSDMGDDAAGAYRALARLKGAVDALVCYEPRHWDGPTEL